MLWGEQAATQLQTRMKWNYAPKVTKSKTKHCHKAIDFKVNWEYVIVIVNVAERQVIQQEICGNCAWFFATKAM